MFKWKHVGGVQFAVIIPMAVSAQLRSFFTSISESACIGAPPRIVHIRITYFVVTYGRGVHGPRLAELIP